MEQVFADLLPDQRIQRLRPHVVGTTARLPGKARLAAAVVVGWRPVRGAAVGQARTLESAAATT